MVNRKGQIWVETVIYTLIALVMIGAVLGFARPKIQEIQDKLTIDRTFEMMKEIDSQILSVVHGGAGNKRAISLDIKKGEMKIDTASEQIIFVIDESKSVYSEPTENEADFLEIDKIGVQTISTTGELNKVTLKLYYGDYDLIGETFTLAKSPSSYSLSITNKGNSQIEIKN